MSLKAAVTQRHLKVIKQSHTQNMTATKLCYV